MHCNQGDRSCCNGVLMVYCYIKVPFTNNGVVVKCCLLMVILFTNGVVVYTNSMLFSVMVVLSNNNGLITIGMQLCS